MAESSHVAPSKESLKILAFKHASPYSFGIPRRSCKPFYKRKMKSQRLIITELAGIQYVGLDGITDSCIKAITCLINGGVRIETASLITCDADHGFLLTSEYAETIAVKAGFGSGYSGEGSRGLATALNILYQHKVEIDEYVVQPSFMHRLSYSCLLQSDLDFIQKGRPVRPHKWYDYLHDRGQELGGCAAQLSQNYPLSIPFSLIDARIIDLAVSFFNNPDAAISSAYRRLEQILRERTGFSEVGTKLFSQAFISTGAPLRWDVPDDGEVKGRGHLFNGTYMAFRNARAHREIDPGLEAELREFLLVNELYRLEAEALTESELREKRDEEAELEQTMRLLEERKATRVKGVFKKIS